MLPQTTLKGPRTKSDLVLFPQIGYADYFYSLSSDVTVFSTLPLCVILVFIKEYSSFTPSVSHLGQ